MAPKQVITQPPATVAVSSGRVKKPKPRKGPVRRLENGLLNVNRKSGKHVKAIKHNSQTPLLRLPVELRTRIWEQVLGGHSFHFGSYTYYPRRVPTVRTWVKDQPKDCFALQQVCRQIHAETALLEYKLNEFSFESEDSFYWVRSDKLLEIRRGAITHIRIATWQADSMLVENAGDYNGYLGELSDYFPAHFFPNLKHIVIEVYGSAKTNISKAEKRLGKSIRAHHRDVRIVFEYRQTTGSD